MPETKTIRLSKVLKEFSIGIDHALDFLGQKVPACLTRAPSAELLSWAVRAFDQQAIPAVAEGLSAGNALCDSEKMSNGH